MEKDRVLLEGGGEIPCGMVLWAGGNAPVPFLQSLGLPLSPRGSLVVDSYLCLPSHPEVYALGDCAAVGEPPAPATEVQTGGKFLR